MTNPIDEALKTHDERRYRIDSYHDLYEAAEGALNKDLDPCFQAPSDSSLWCTIYPETKAIMIQALRDLAKAGIRNQRFSTPYLNGQAWAYSLVDRRGRALHLFCDLSKSKTCNLVKVGTRTESVYEVQCS